MPENSKRWDEDVPPDLIPAIKALRKGFDDTHWKFGRLTQVLCFSRLHNGDIKEVEEYLRPLQQAKMIVGSAATQRFHDLLKVNTPPSIFKGFFDLYLDGVTLTMLSIFRDLVEIGRANEQQLVCPHLEWAQSQTLHLIRYRAYRIESWVRDVCDVQPYDPNDDSDENIFWRKWQAPRLLIMKPSLYRPYEPDCVWERDDLESSSRLLKHFSEHYVLHLDVQLKRAAGEAVVQLAKQPRPIQTDPAPDPLPQDTAPIVTGARAIAISAKLEVRKMETQKKYRAWQKHYSKLVKNRPEMSDVWYSHQIARMPIGRGRSAETIRKHMKQ